MYFFFCIINCKCVKLLLKAEDGVKFFFFFLYILLQNMVLILSNIYFYFFHDVNSITVFWESI